MQRFRVAFLGLKSHFGRASSFLLKQCPSIYNLRLYDENDVSTADDLSLINTPCKVESYKGKHNLNQAVKDSDIVLICDDFYSTPYTCFDVMAPKMEDYAKAIAESSPNAVIIVAASPINKLIPVLSELLLEKGFYDCNKVIGMTAVHNVRANSLLASYLQTDPRKICLPVIGGDSEETIVPLFSQAKPKFNISEAVMKRLVDEIKQGSSLIYEMKKSSEALNKAYSTIKFLNSVMAGLRGEPNIMNIAFTRTTQVEGIEYFALPVLLGRFGIQARYGIPKLLPFETDLVFESVFNLKKDIDNAKYFCKSRDTAVELCNRNVANRLLKSKEFERLVNDLKTEKKRNKPHDKLINRLTSLPNVGSGSLEGQKPFDPVAFCKKIHHEKDFRNNHSILPKMKSDTDIAPSVIHAFRKDKTIDQCIAALSLIQTPTCEPIVYPENPLKEPVIHSNNSSLVERIVHQATEKMLSEKENDKHMKNNLAVSKKKIKNSVHKAVQSNIDGDEHHNKHLKHLKNKHVKEINHKKNIEKYIHEDNNQQNKDLSINLFDARNEKDNCDLTSFKEKTSSTNSKKTLLTFKQRKEYELAGRLHGSLKSNEVALVQKGGIHVAKGIKSNKVDIYSGISKFNNVASKYLPNKPQHSSTSCNLLPLGINKTELKGNDSVDSLLLDKCVQPRQRKSTPVLNNSDDWKNKMRSVKRIFHLLNNNNNLNKKVNKELDKKDRVSDINPRLSEDLVFEHTSEETEKIIMLDIGNKSSKNEIKCSYHGNLDPKLSRQATSSKNQERFENEKNIKLISKEEKKNYFSDKYKYNRNLLQSSADLLKEVALKKKFKTAIKNKENENSENVKFLVNGKTPKQTSEKKIICDSAETNLPLMKGKFVKKESICNLESSGSKSFDEKRLYVMNKKNKSEDKRRNIEPKVNNLGKNISLNKSVNKRDESCPRSTLKNETQVELKNLPLYSSDKNSTTSKTIHTSEDICGSQKDVIGKDISIFMKILDQDVFKCNKHTDDNEVSKKENEKVNNAKRNKLLRNSSEKEKEGIVSLTMQSATLTTEENKIETKSKMNQNESGEIKKTNLDDISLTEKPADNDENIKSSKETVPFAGSLSKVHEESKPLSEIHESIEKEFLKIIPHSPNQGSVSSPERIISGKYTHQESVSEGNDCNEKHMKQKPKNDFLIQLADKCNKTMEKEVCFKGQYTNVDNLSDNMKISRNLKLKSSFTISEKSIDRKRGVNNRLNTFKPSNPCKNDLNTSKTLSLKNIDDKIAISENFAKSKDSSTKYSKNKLDKLNMNKSKFVGSLNILNTSNSDSRKKDKVQDNVSIMSNHIGRTVSNINKNEHSFKMTDKNGFLGFFLKKGFLPKAENVRDTTEKQYSVFDCDNTSLFKTKVNNDDMFMGIKNKSKNLTAKLQSKESKKGSYNLCEENKKDDPLLITHNSVYGPKCPIHGHKYCIREKDPRKHNFQKDNERLLTPKNANLLNNLCRLSGKIDGNKQSHSSHHFNQKAHHFKTYSTLTQSRPKSPLRLLLEKRKNLAKYPRSKNQLLGTKPKPAAGKLTITSILEKKVKKMDDHQQRDLDSNKESYIHEQQEICKLKERNKMPNKLFIKSVPPYKEETNKTIHLTKNFFTTGIDSSYLKWSMKNAPISREPWPSNSNELMKKRNPSICKLENPIFYLTWPAPEIKDYKLSSNSASNENDILTRGTCSEHYKNNFLKENPKKCSLSCIANDNRQKTSVDQILNIFSKYSNEFTPCEYTKGPPIPSLRSIVKKNKK